MIEEWTHRWCATGIPVELRRLGALALRRIGGDGEVVLPFQNAADEARQYIAWTNLDEIFCTCFNHGVDFLNEAHWVSDLICEDFFH